MIKVYFETERPKYAELVAVFANEDIYMACLPILEKKKEESGFDVITESDEGEINEEY